MFSTVRRKFLVNCHAVMRLTRVGMCNFSNLRNMTVVKSLVKPIDKDLFIETPIDVKIDPIDYVTFPDNNKISVEVYSEGENNCHLTLNQSACRLELLNQQKPAASNIKDICVIRVPVNLNIQISSLNDAAVNIGKLQVSDFSVKTQKGSVQLQDITSKGSIKVESEQGLVTCQGKMLADIVDIKTGLNANIKCNNLVANRVNIRTEGGSIFVESCYSDASHFITVIGNINVNYLHRTSIIDIVQSGNLSINSFEGTLKASLKSGNVFMHANKFLNKSNIFIHEKGTVEMHLWDFENAMVVMDLIADKIDLDEGLEKFGQLMVDSHPQRFRVPGSDSSIMIGEVHVECRNGVINLKQSDTPFHMGT